MLSPACPFSNKVIAIFVGIYRKYVCQMIIKKEVHKEFWTVKNP